MMGNHTRLIESFLATAGLVVVMAGYAEARPVFGNANCSACHTTDLDSEVIDVTGTDPPGLLDPAAWDEGGGHGPLQAFTVAPGGTVSLSGLTLSGIAPETNAALALKRFEKKGDNGSPLEPHLLGGSAGWEPFNDLSTGALYYYQYVETTRGPFSFDLTIDAGTPVGIYDLAFAVAGGSMFPDGTPTGVGKWYSDEHFYLQVQAPAFPRLTTTPADGGSINFGNVLVGQIGSAILSAANSGGAGSTLSGTFPAAGGQFGPSGPLNFGPLGQGESDSRTYTYAPASRGPSSRSLTVTSDGGDATVALSGTGVAPVQSVETGGVDAGLVRIGTSGIASLSVRNVGDGNLSGVGAASNLRGTVAAGSGSFSGPGGSLSLPDGESRSFDFTYAPSGHTSDSTMIALEFSNGSADGTNAAESFEAELLGRGVGPIFDSSLAPGSLLDFGSVLPGQTETLPLTFGNVTGDPHAGNLALTDLSVLSATIEGPDAELFSIPDFVDNTVIHQGESLELSLNFDSFGLSGSKAATLSILTDQGVAGGSEGASFVFDLAGSFFDLNIDGNGVADALTDGVLMMRYLFGFRDEQLVRDALALDATRTDPGEIVDFLDASRSTMLDVDGNGAADALTDGVLVMRYLFGFTGESLVEDALAPDATRTDPEDVLAYLDSYQPANRGLLGKASVPEPSSLILTASGLAMLIGYACRRRRGRSRRSRQRPLDRRGFQVESLEQRALLSIGGIGHPDVLLPAGAAGMDLQIITAEPSSPAANPGNPLSFDVRYTTDPADATLMGLGLRMHFNSAAMTFDGLSDVLQTNLLQQQLQDDTADFDGDPTTDRLVLIAWQDFAAGQWPGQIPTVLFTANFTASETAAGSTSVNFTSSSTPAGWTLNSTPAEVIFVENNPPTAADDTYDVNEDTELVVDPTGVLTNDTDAEGDPLSAVLVSGPSQGTLNLNTDGSLTYSPDENFHGVDTFTYKANDGSADSNAATVTINVQPVNDPPAAADDDYAVDEDTELVVDTSSVLDNDTDVDGDSLSAVLVSEPSHGTLQLSDEGSFTYTPNDDFHGIDTFTYQAHDGSADSDAATVTITVNPVADPPVAADDAYAVDEDTELVVDTSSVLDNDADADGDLLSAVLVAGPANGALQLSEDGTFTYLPNDNFHGVDTFTYKAHDGWADSNEATVTITVRPVNDPPLAGDDRFATERNTVLVEDAPGVLGDDSDVDGDSLLAVLVSGPSDGTLQLAGDGSFTYTPDADFVGNDNFSYTANDGQDDSNEATVTISVGLVNEPPTAVDDAYAVDEDHDLVVETGGVLDNDADPEGDSLSAVLVGGPTNGTLQLSDDGSFTYTPNHDFHGTDSFRYKADDGLVASEDATVMITVEAVNDPPVASDDAYAVDENQELVLGPPGVLENDTDVDGDPPTAVLVSGPSHGTLQLSDDGSFTYTPEEHFYGTDSFTYRAADAQDESNQATVTITVHSVNDPPLAADDGDYHVDAFETLWLAAPGVLANDSDAEGDPLSAVLVSGPSHGTVELAADGSFTYTSTEDFDGVDSFSYRASDGQDESNQATVTINVHGTLGTIDYLEKNDLDPAGGDLWFRFATLRDGILTAKLSAEQFGPNTELKLLAISPGGDRVELARAATRIDYAEATAGQSFGLRIIGLSDAADLVLANLLTVSPDGSQVSVYGTAGDDTFEVSAGDPLTIVVKGVAYDFDSVAKVDVLGQGGSDAAALSGSDGADVATVHPNSVNLKGSAYEMTATDVASVTIHGGGGENTADVFDSPGDDNLVAFPAYAAISGPLFSGQGGFHHQLRGFSEVHAQAGDGVDVVKFYDSPGHDTFVATPTYASISGPGPSGGEGFEHVAEFFEGAHAFATAGGVDVAKFYDSPGKDRYVAWPTHTALMGDGFYNRAKYFEGIHAYATAGEYDTAEFYDSPANDEFVATPTYAALFHVTYHHEYTNGFYNRAKYFEEAQAFALADGIDVARFYDSPEDDSFYGEPDYGALSNETYSREYTNGFYDRANHFEGVHAYATAGGIDKAELRGSENDDIFYGDPIQVALYRPNDYYNRAKFFEEVYGEVGAEGRDEAFFYDSPSVDLLEAGTLAGDGNWIRLSNQALDYFFQAQGFDYVKPTATDPGSNSQNLPNDLSVLDFELDLTDW